mgnify:FL=1|jgi:hypothetical protein
MSQMKFWLLMLGLSMSWLFIIPEIIILILLIIGVEKYEILVTGIDHILSLCYIYISLPSIVDFVSGGETSIYSLVIFSNVIIYIVRIIIVSCNKDKKIKIFCMIVTGILGKATWVSILMMLA